MDAKQVTIIATATVVVGSAAVFVTSKIRKNRAAKAEAVATADTTDTLNV